MVATDLTFQNFPTFPYFSLKQNQISLTKQIQNVRSSCGFWPQLTAALFVDS